MNDPAVNIALVVPLQGPLGIIGPSSELCAQLAVEEINAVSGVLGRELRLVTVDGGAPPRTIAAEVEALVRLGRVQAVTGAHTSAVRAALVPAVAGRVPYIYTSLYEGGERSPGVFVTGETPGRQLLPAMRMFARERGLRRWSVVGNDYMWPRGTAELARGFLRREGGTISDEVYVPLGTGDFGDALDRVERSGADAVLVLLVGQDAVEFHRQFGRRGLHERMPRLTTLMDENMLMAAGPEATGELFASAGYFASLATADSLDFTGRYVRRFGAEAPIVGSLGESCYEGVRLFAALAELARSLDVCTISSVADAVVFEGARGALRLRDRHAAQRIFFAEATGLDFSVLAELPPLGHRTDHGTST
ncbi:substrate-binding domain-containing protein [Streptomyces solisilvae]|uniref:substrate-binding domain-containing protein n=1 Tax=Streptomyces malaysiensis TaxID=92644 RepID=UPI00367CF37C